jgi:hypothetical protein
MNVAEWKAFGKMIREGDIEDESGQIPEMRLEVI